MLVGGDELFILKRLLISEEKEKVLLFPAKLWCNASLPLTIFGFSVSERMNNNSPHLFVPNNEEKKSKAMG